MRTSSGGGGSSVSHKRRIALARAQGRQYASQGRQIQTQSHRQKRRAAQPQRPAATIPLVGNVIRAPARAPVIAKRQRQQARLDKAIRAAGRRTKYGGGSPYPVGAVTDLYLAPIAVALRKYERRMQRRGFGGAADYYHTNPQAARSTIVRRGDIHPLGEPGPGQNQQNPYEIFTPERAAMQMSGFYTPKEDVSRIARSISTGGYLAGRQTQAEIKARRMAPSLKVLDQLMRPTYAVGGAIHGLKEGDVGKAAELAYRGGVQMKDKYTPGKEIIGEGGGAIGAIGRFALDVGLDPTTYITLGGASLVGKTAAKAAIRAEAVAARGAYEGALAQGVSKSVARKLARDAGRRQGRQVFDRRMAAAREGGSEADLARGLTVRVAGGRTARKVGHRIAPGVSRRLSKTAGRDATERRAAAPLTRATAWVGPARRGGQRRVYETKLGQALARKTGYKPGIASQAARRVGSSLHGGVRSWEVAPGDFGDLKALVREARSAEEHGVRMSIARANLGRKLTDAEDAQIIHAIERNKVGSLKDPNVRAIAKDYRDDLRYRFRRETRSGTLTGEVGPKGSARTRTSVALRTRQERLARERKSHVRTWEGERKTVREAEERAAQAKTEHAEVTTRATRERVAREQPPESAWFKPRPNAKNPRHGKGYIDREGKLHTWNESEGTHAEIQRARGHKGGEDFVIRPDGTISVHGGEKLADNEIIARAMAQDPRLKPPRDVDPNARPIDANGKEHPSLNDELARVGAEYAPSAAAQTRRQMLNARANALAEEVERLEGKVIPQARSRAGKARKQVRKRQGPLGRTAVARKAERAANKEKAQGYFPRIPDEQVEATQTLLQKLATPLRPKREAVSSSKPRTAPSKGREYKRTREEMKAGTEQERAAVARQHEKSGVSVAYRGIKGSRGERASKINRAVAERFGEPARNFVQRMKRDHGEDWRFDADAMETLRGQGKSVYRIERGDLVQLGPKDIDEIKTGLKSTSERAARARQAQAMKANGATAKQIREALGGEAETGRYVVLDDAYVGHAQKGQQTWDTEAAGQLWDTANRAFKSLALATPQYLARNFAGDMFNAWTEENALRLMRNSGKAQKALHQLGRYERGIALGAKGQKKLNAVGQLEAAGRKFAGMLPSNKRTIQLSPAQARELAGPSADRLYNLIRKANPDMSKAQIRDQIERNLSQGKVPAIHVALLAEQMGVVRNGRFLELMQEGRREFGKGPGRSGVTPWQAAVKRVEDSTRLATFMGGLQRGMSPREAANRATKLHFDYGDLTTIERQAFRRLMPFYTFPSRNIPLQAKQLVTRPGKYATLEKGRQTAAEAAGLDRDEWQARQNDFEARQLPIPIRVGTDKNGKPKIFTLSMGQPFTDLNDITSFAEGVASPAGGGGKDFLNVADIPIKRISEMFGPVKWPFEVHFNKSAYFREDIAPKGARLTRAPEWAVQLAKAPGMGWLQGATGMGSHKPGDPVMWDKRAEFAIRSSLPGIAGQVSEVGGKVSGLGAEKNWRGRTFAQKQLNFWTGLRATKYDTPEIKAQEDYKRSDQLDTLMENYRQMAKEAGITDPKKWRTPKYQRWLDERNEIRNRLEGKASKGGAPESTGDPRLDRLRELRSGRLKPRVADPRMDRLKEIRADRLAAAR